jgi:hypothetical protein
MGVAGFILGTILAQFAGGWAYWTSKRRWAFGETRARLAAGVTTAVVAGVAYVPLGVHRWLSGEDGTWVEAAFIGVCVGLIQGILFRGRPLTGAPN